VIYEHIVPPNWMSIPLSIVLNALKLLIAIGRFFSHLHKELRKRIVFNSFHYGFNFAKARELASLDLLNVILKS
jgi:hypothetical protein